VTASQLSIALVDELTQFGLTENEAKTYLALLQLKQASARSIARLANIPRQEIYRVLPKLEELGLIELIPTKPAQFMAVSPSEILSELIEHQRAVFSKKISDLEKRQNSLKNELEKVEGKSAGLTQPTAIQFVLISGRRLVNETIDKMLKKASNTVLWVSPRLEVKRAVIYDRDELLRRCARRGVKIRILTEVGEDNVEEIRRLGKFCEIRNVPGIASMMTIVDDKEIMIGSAVHSGDDEIIHELWTNDLGQIRTMKEFFERVWKDSKPATLALQ
jgi:sugar-specific transcriptional regulator TrmB